jgi:flagellar motor protein MotB
MNQEYLNESHLDAAEIPEKPAFSHSVKLEQTAKGVRVTIHVSADNFADARMQSTELFIKVQQDLQIQGIPLAPVELKNGGVKA